MADSSQLTRRYRRLVDELRKEHGRDYGSDKIIAERLGVKQTSFSRIAKSEQRNIGADLLWCAVKTMKLRPAYFFDLAEPKSYKDYQRKTNDALSEFLADPNVSPPNDIELAILESVDFCGATPTKATYHAILVAIRGTDLSVETVERTRSETASNRAKIQRAKKSSTDR